MGVARGLGVAEDAFFGASVGVATDQDIQGALSVFYGITVNGDSAITSDTAAESTATAAFTVTGGVGVGESMYLGKDLKVLGESDADPSALDAGSLVVSGGVTIAKQAVIGSTVTANADVAVLGTDPAVTNSNATLTVGGGVGIGKNAIIAGTVEVEDTTASADSASGAVTVAGGLGGLTRGRAGPLPGGPGGHHEVRKNRANVLANSHQNPGCERPLRGRFSILSFHIKKYNR